MRLCGIPVAVFLIAAGVVLYVNGQREVIKILTGAIIVTLSLLPLLLLVAFVVSGSGARWFVTEEGLKRVMIGGGREMIPWEQIYHMAGKDNGLFIRWRTPVPPEEGKAEKYLEYHAVLYPAKIAADELIALWQQQTSRELQAEGETHFRSVNLQSYNRMLLSGWTMIAAGTVLIVWGVAKVVQDYPSTGWPSVEGKIVSQQYRLLPSHGLHHRHGGGQVILSYEYVIAGQTNRSDRYSLSHAKYDDEKAAAEAFAQEHQPETSVKVYYNPKYPQHAVLLPGPDWLDNAALIGLGLCAMALGILIRNIFGKYRQGQKVLKSPV